MEPDKLFGKLGRHHELIRGIQTSSRDSDIRKMLTQYQSLWTKRVRADYNYGVKVTYDEAESAVSDAAWVAKQLANAQDKEFESFPLEPRQGYRSGTGAL